MASLAMLTDQAIGWLNRRDIGPLVPGWVLMTETDIAEVLRARCMVARSRQPITGAFIELPPDFITIESIRDAKTGEPLALEDEFTGPAGGDNVGTCPVSSYRLVGDCIEFLPHPQLPLPAGVAYQDVLFNWYQRPKPLVAPQDTNPVLENLFQVYLFGVCKYGALFELDDDRATQATSSFNEAVTNANLWKQASDYSGAPLRAVVKGF